MLGVMPETRGRGVEGTSARFIKVALDEASDQEGFGGRETIATIL